MSKIPEQILQAGCSAYCAKFLNGRGAFGEAIEDAYFAIHDHEDWVKSGQKAWNGEGLPPVGATCERRFPDVEFSSWQGGIVLAHGSRKIFFRDNCGDEWAHSIDDVEFRPFRTPEQIAEEARLAELNEMVRNVKDHPRGRHGADHLTQLRIQEEACIDLYDAGYRKQVKP